MRYLIITTTITIIILFLLTIITPISFAFALSLTDYQKKILNISYGYGKKYFYGGGEIVQGIAFQETLLGLLKNNKNNHSHEKDIEKQYFGIMQLKICAFKDVNRYFKLKLKLTPDEIVDRLKKDDEFNIYIGTLYLKYLFQYFDRDIDKTILAYNIGMGFVKRNGLKYDPNQYIKNTKIKIIYSIYYNIKNKIY